MQNVRVHFQRYNLLTSLSADENAALPAIYSGLNASDRNKRAVQLLKQLDLGNKLANKPNELSGGQQQRVSIARALMNGGEIILADEPTGALDSKSGEMVMEIIKNLHAQGHTIIWLRMTAKSLRKPAALLKSKTAKSFPTNEKPLTFTS